MTIIKGKTSNRKIMTHEKQCPICQTSDSDNLRICMFHIRLLYEKITGESISDNIAELVELSESYEI
jgi:hypothetical protein